MSRTSLSPTAHPTLHSEPTFTGGLCAADQGGNPEDSFESAATKTLQDNMLASLSQYSPPIINNNKYLMILINLGRFKDITKMYM